jgi:uncharacterized protein (TIGR02147 family)
VLKSDLKRLSASIAPTSFVEPREYLAAVYNALKVAVPQYSYVQFTEDLGFGACNAMYLIIHGHRPLTTKGAAKICSALGMTGTERRYFTGLVEASRPKKGRANDEALEKLMELKAKSLPTDLSRDQLAFYNEWYHSAILELLSLADAKDDPEWLSQALEPSVTVLKVEKSLALLKKLGFIVFDQQKKRWLPAQDLVSTGQEVLGMAIIRYHQQMIELGKAAMIALDPDQRDISAVTIGFPESKLTELKAKIQAFRRELLKISGAQDSNDTIVQVNIQMFPVAMSPTRGKRRDKNK